MTSYPATVFDNQDPERRGRIRVICTAIMGGSEAFGDPEPLDDWIEMKTPYGGAGYGWFFVPAKGAPVDIEAEEDGETFVSSPNFRWVGCLYPTTQAIPTEFGTGAGLAYGQRFGIKTPGGAVLLFDDFRSALALVQDVIELGAENLLPLDGVVTGRGIDPSTGLTYFALGNASSIVLAKKAAL